MRTLGMTIALGLMLTATACNRGGETKDGLTAKQNADLDNAAAMLDGNQDIDTSPDSLVPEDANMAGPTDAVPVVNNAAPAQGATPPPGNGAARR